MLAFSPRSARTVPESVHPRGHPVAPLKKPKKCFPFKFHLSFFLYDDSRRREAGFPDDRISE
jgi:hypothetical protein